MGARIAKELPPPPVPLGDVILKELGFGNLELGWVIAIVLLFIAFQFVPYFLSLAQSVWIYIYVFFYNLVSNILGYLPYLGIKSKSPVYGGYSY
jgi:hypothetical protein